MESSLELMVGRFVRAGLWGVLALALAPSLAHAQCTKDTDCKGERVCEQGKCTWPVPPAAAAAPAPAVTPSAPTGSEADGVTPAEPGAPSAGPEGVASPASEPAEPMEPAAAEPEPAPPPREPAVAPKRVRSAPAPLPKDEPPVQRRSRPAVISGIVMVSIGPLALLGALAAKNSQDSCDEELERDYPDHVVPSSERYRTERCDSYTAPIYVLGIGGALLTGIGVPLIIFGAKTKPRASTVELQPWATPTAGGVRGGLKLRLSM